MATNWDPVSRREPYEPNKIKKCEDLFTALPPTGAQFPTAAELELKLDQWVGKVVGGQHLLELYLYSVDGSGSEADTKSYRIVLAVELSLHRKPRKPGNHGPPQKHDWYMHVGILDENRVVADYEAVKDICREFLEPPPPCRGRNLFVVGDNDHILNGGTDPLYEQLKADKKVVKVPQPPIKVGRGSENYHYYSQARPRGLGPNGTLGRLLIKKIKP